MPLELNLEESIKRILLDVLSIYSPSGGEGRLALYLLSLLRELGYHDTWIDDAGNVVSVKKGSGPVIWLHAHMDTVPGELPVRDEGEYVAGRGAVDDKGPLVSYLLAYHLAQSSATLVLALVVDEEGRSIGTTRLVEDGGVPRPHAVLVGEPTNMHIVYAYRGGAKLVIRRGSSGGHASSSPIYVNPIEEVFETYLNIVNRLPAGQRFSDFTVTPTFVRCGDAPNKIPNECVMVVDVRIPLDKNCDYVAEVARTVSVEVTGCLDPVSVNPTNPVARALMRSMLRRGVKPLLSKKWGTSDMNILVNLTGNIAAFGPGDPALAHTDHERISIQDIVTAAHIIRDAVEELPKLLKT